MKNGDAENVVTEDVVEAARKNPNGWVCKIDGLYGPTEYIPPEAVVGAWKVDENGNLTGEFLSNQNYKVSLI